MVIIIRPSIIYGNDVSGTIDVDELGTVMRSMGLQPSDEDVQDMINEADQDGNGTIDFQEFIQMMPNMDTGGQTDNAEEHLKEAFAVFDMDGDGTITADELKSIMKNLGETLSDEEVEEMVKEADIDGDGVIDYNEFCRMMFK